MHEEPGAMQPSASADHHCPHSSTSKCSLLECTANDCSHPAINRIHATGMVFLFSQSLLAMLCSCLTRCVLAPSGSCSPFSKPLMQPHLGPPFL
jgi:hypothetical protein